MRSKKFSFKRSIIKNDLRHSWPLWLCATLPLVLYQLALVVGLRQEYRLGQLKSLTELGEGIRSTWVNLIEIAPFFNLIYGCLAAMLLLQSLYTSRSVIGIHALPITREQNWLGWVVSGFALEMIPLTITLLLGVLGWLGLPGLTFGSLPLMGLYVVWMLCTFAWGFGFALFCGMFTGQLWTLPVFTLVLNLLGYFLSIVFEMFRAATLYGYGGGGAIEAGFYFSPLVLTMARISRVRRNGLIWMEGIGSILMLGGLGLVFLVLALVAYRLRPLERAGELVVFRPFRTVFRIGFAVCLSLCGGLFGAALTNRLSWQILLYILIFGALGMVLAQVALKKNFHFLSRRLLVEYLLTFGVVSAIFAYGMQGGFGFNHWVPDPTQVASITVRNVDTMYAGNCGLSNVTVTVDSPEEIEAVVQWHQAYLNRYPDQKAVDDAEKQLDYADMVWGENCGRPHMDLTYQMKNGEMERRLYYFPITKEAVETEGTMEWQLEQLWQLLTTPERYMKESADLWEIEATVNEKKLYYGRGRADTLALVDALVRDIALQHKPLSLFAEGGEMEDECVYLSAYGSGYQWFSLTEKQFPNTMQLLYADVQAGYGEEGSQKWAVEQ